MALGELVFGVITELIEIGDLFMAGVDAFPKEETVEVVLKAGLADGGVPKAPTLEAGAGVLITTGVGAFVLGRTGLRLLALRIGVSLWFDARTGDESCQLGPT